MRTAEPAIEEAVSVRPGAVSQGVRHERPFLGQNGHFEDELDHADVGFRATVTYRASPTAAFPNRFQNCFTGGGWYWTAVLQIRSNVASANFSNSFRAAFAWLKLCTRRLRTE